MFTVEQLEAKLAQLAQEVEQSAANHHILVGSKMTIQGFLAEAKKAAEVVSDVCTKVEQVCDTASAVAEVVN